MLTDYGCDVLRTLALAPSALSCLEVSYVLNWTEERAKEGMRELEDLHLTPKPGLVEDVPEVRAIAAVQVVPAAGDTYRVVWGGWPPPCRAAGRRVWPGPRGPPPPGGGPGGGGPRRGPGGARPGGGGGRARRRRGRRPGWGDRVARRLGRRSGPGTW
jgi:hypothetical protein